MKKKIIFTLLCITPLTISCGGSSSPTPTTGLYTYRDVYTHNSYYGRSTAPQSGSPKLLVIPVWFTDSGNYITELKKESVREDIETAYFGSPEETGWHSLSSYYELDSFGKVHLQGTVTPWFECGEPASNYYSDGSGKTTQLLLEGIKWYKEYSGDDKLADYDTDKDGYLDGVAMIYACPDYGNIDTGGGTNLWAYCTWNFGALANIRKPNLMNYFWASYDFLYGDNALERTGSEYNTGDTRYVTLDTHAFIHEMGHNFGLPDYYDYTGNCAYAGGFSMQDYNSGGHDPYSAFALGWANPIVPNRSKKITLHSFVDTSEFILLSPDYSRSPFDEYILVELFTPTGINELDCLHNYKGRYPMGTNEPVIRIWHVDARLYNYTKSKLTTVPSGSMIFEATNNNSNDGSAWYPNYHTLSLIRNNNSEATYDDMGIVEQSDYFYEGDTFSIKEFSAQFYRGSKLNKNKALGWSISVDEIGEDYAVINCTKTVQ